MNKFKILVSLVAATLTLSPVASADIIFSFDIDTSNWTDTSYFTDDDTLVIGFEDTADLYDITVSNILSLKYNISGIDTETAYFGGADTRIEGDIGEQFSFDGTTMSIDFLTTFDPNSYNSLYLLDSSDQPIVGLSTSNNFSYHLHQIFDLNGLDQSAIAWIPDANASLTGTQISDSTSGTGGGEDGGSVGGEEDGGSVGGEEDGGSNGDAVSVPEPSIFALFAAGLVGLGFARRRLRQS